MLYHETFYQLCWNISDEVTNRTLGRLICFQYGLEPLATFSLVETALHGFDEPKLYATCTGHEQSVHDCLVKPVRLCDFLGVACKSVPRSSGESPMSNALIMIPGLQLYFYLQIQEDQEDNLYNVSLEGFVR